MHLRLILLVLSFFLALDSFSLEKEYEDLKNNLTYLVPYEVKPDMEYSSLKKYYNEIEFIKHCPAMVYDQSLGKIIIKNEKYTNKFRVFAREGNEEKELKFLNPWGLGGIYFTNSDVFLIIKEAGVERYTLFEHDTDNEVSKYYIDVEKGIMSEQ